MNPTLQSLILIHGVLISLLTLAGLLVWVERRLLALWQDRLGPNRCGPFGILIFVADGIKMFTKEDWIPPTSDKPVFVMAPAIIVITALLSFAIIPVTPGIVVLDLNIGILYFLGLSSIGIYSTVLGGWASNNKYSLLGGLRMSAQMFSYEVFMGLALMGVVILSGSLNLREIVEAQSGMWYVAPQFLGFLIFFFAGLAESHRLPFDMPEAESELVAGFHSEYSSMKFGMFFVGEYVGITVISGLIVTLFFGGWQGPLLPPMAWFILKTMAFILFFILIRAAIPRPRFDQLLGWGWKYLLPLALLNLVVTGAVVLALED